MSGKKMSPPAANVCRAPSAAPMPRTASSHLFFRGQAALETLLMVGIVFAFIVPLVFIFYSSTGARTQALNAVQAQALAQAMSDTAGEVWYGGNGTRMLMLVSFPSDMLNITLGGDLVPPALLPMRGHEISIALDHPPQGVDEIMIVSPGPVRSVPPVLSPDGRQLLPSERDRTLLVQRISTPGSHLRSGLVALIFENRGDYVNIIRKVDKVS